MWTDWSLTLNSVYLRKRRNVAQKRIACLPCTSQSAGLTSVGFTGLRSIWQRTSPSLGLGTSPSTTSNPSSFGSWLNFVTWTCFCFWGMDAMLDLFRIRSSAGYSRWHKGVIRYSEPTQSEPTLRCAINLARMIKHVVRVTTCTHRTSSMWGSCAFCEDEASQVVNAALRRSTRAAKFSLHCMHAVTCEI